MGRMLRTRLLGLVFVGVMPGGMFAFQATPLQQPDSDTAKIRASSNAVLIDASVRDRKGLPLRGLKAEDFQIYEDGELQIASTVEEFSSGSPKRTARTEQGETHQIGAVTGSVPLIRSSLRGGLHDSCVAVVIPSLSPGGSGWVTAWKTLRDYVENFMPEGTRVGIFLIDLEMYKLKMIQFFTSDQKKLIEMADQARTDPAAIGTGSGGSGFGGGAGEELSQLITYLQAKLITDAFSNLIYSMQMLPGRKSILYMSQAGVPLPQIIVHRFWEIVHLAHDFGVTFYTMDVEGLRVGRVYHPSARSSLNGLGSPMLRSSGLRNMLLQDPHYSMNVLAKETGGLFIRDTNDFRGGLARIEEQRESYYLLSYVPKNQNFDGRYRRVQVKVRIPDAQVHARNGYYAVDAEFREPLLEYEAPALTLAQQGKTRTELPVEAEVLNFPTPDHPGLVAVLAGLGPGQIAYADEADGRVSDFCFLTLFRDSSGEVARKISQQYRLSGTDDPKKKDDGILFYRLTAVQPGDYTVETVGFDAVSGHAATRRSRLMIPTPNPDLPGLSSLVFIQRSEKLPDAGPSSDSPLRYGDLLLYPRVGDRISKARTSTLDYFFTVYPTAARTPTQARLQLLRLNQPVGEQDLSLPSPDDLGRIQFASALALDKLPTGTYTMRLLIAAGDRFVVRSRRFLLVP